MSSVYEQRLEALSGAEQAPLLTAIQRGIEKESLRVSADAVPEVQPGRGTTAQAV